MSASAPSTVSVGDVLLGKYRVVGELGAGGMGRVVDAEHVELDRRVALKILHADLAARPGFAERFVREARIVANLSSPHVARVLDVDRLPDGTPVLVMERLDGRDLDALLDERGPLPVDDAAWYVLQAIDALAEAHDRGVVHRDVKPANLFIAHDPAHGEIVKVLDFGVAKVVDDASLTSTGHAVGSPRYMAPEQIRRSAAIDARADVWALGVTLARLVGERHPFDGDDAISVAALVLETPPDLDGVHDATLRQIIARCLEKRPDDRFEDVTALADALTPLAGERGEAARAASSRRRAGRRQRATTPAAAPRGTPTETFEVPLAARDETPALPEPGPRRRVGVVAVAVALALVGLFIVARPRDRASSSPPAITAPSSPRVASSAPVAVEVSPAPPASVAAEPDAPAVRPASRASRAPAVAVAPPPAVTASSARTPEPPSAPPPEPAPEPPPPRRDPLGDRK